MRTLRLSLCAVAVAWLGVLPVSAAPIEYIFTGTGTGTLIQATSQTIFTDAPFQIRVNAESESVIDQLGGLFSNEALSATITIDGVGSFSVTEPTSVFVNNGNDIVGFNSPSSADLFDVFNLPSLISSFYGLAAVYPLETGPVTCCAGQWNALQTNGGIIDMISFGNTGTFEARTGQVPEPGTLALLATAILLPLVRRRVQA